MRTLLAQPACAALVLACSLASAAQSPGTPDTVQKPKQPSHARHHHRAPEERPTAAAPAPATHPPETAYDFGLPAPDGQNLPLGGFRGKVLLIVNLGRDSSYAAQLPALEKLSSTFKDKGLVVLGVPSNDFGHAEPGTPAQVAAFYAAAKVDFPVMQISTLTGVHELPLFTFLTHSKSVPGDGLHWNFTKFLVDRKGHVIARFPPEVAPESLELQATVQEVLDGTWKPRKPPQPHVSEQAANVEADD